MTDEGRAAELERLRRRSAELATEHQALRARRAEVAEAAAAVHDEAARVHEELSVPVLLDPQRLREHAQADRAIAGEERAALAAELAAEAERRD